MQPQSPTSTLPSYRSPAVDRRRGQLLAFCGVLVLSVDSLLVRLAHTDGWTILFWRGLFMLLSLTAAAWLRDRSRGLTGLKEPLTWLVGLLFTLSTASFVLSVMLTRVANTVVLISAGPLFAALFSRWFLRETVAPRTWLAILVATGGVVAVCFQSLAGGGLVGDLLALGNALLMGASMTILRRHQNLSRTLMLAVSGALLALLAWPFAEPLVPDGRGLLVLAVMGLVQMPLALVLLTDATRYLPAAEVSLFLLLETVLASLLAWMFLGEAVLPATLVGGLLIVGTLALHALVSLRAEQG